MAGMPEMQEQFPAMAMDGRYAGNAGAISGDSHGWPVCRKMQEQFSAMQWMAGMPEMQEPFPAGNFFGTLLYFARRHDFPASWGIAAS